MPVRASEKIMLVGPAAPYRGGIAHFLHATRKGLQRRGHSVEVVNFSRQYPALLFPGKTQYDTDPHAEAPGSVRMLDSVNPLSWWKTARYIAAKNPKLVIFMHWMPFFAPAYGFVARRLRARGIRVLCLVHNALPHEQRPGDRAMSRYFFRACDGFVVLSDAVASDLKMLGIQAGIRLAGHPVYEHFGAVRPREEARQQLGLRPTQPVLLFFGFVRKYKGLHLLLDSMPAVRERLPDVHLLVAGECYGDDSRYRNQVRSLGIENHVTLRLEYIPDHDIPVLFSAADVVVQPYISASQSGVAQIAYHFDRPLIVTDVGGLAEIVPHERAGLVVPPEDPEALAAAVVRFFEERMGPQLEQGVLVEKEKYSWDQLVDTIAQFLNDIPPPPNPKPFH